MDYYLSLTVRCNKSREHSKALWKCAYPPISSPDSACREHEARRPTMFFLQEELKKHFGKEETIEDLLKCKCPDCDAGRKNSNFSNLDRDTLIERIPEKDGPLALALLVYLSKLHFIYFWNTRNIKKEGFRSAINTFLMNTDVKLHSNSEMKAVFEDALKQAIPLFDPVKLDFDHSPYPSRTTYEEESRFPFCNVKILSKDSSSTLRRFEIHEEYCSKEIRKHMDRYQGSVIGHGSERKLLFASKSVKKNKEASFEESVVLRSINADRESTIENVNVISLLTCYTWRDEFYFIFPFIESDLYKHLNESGHNNVSIMKTGIPLPKHWLWRQMIGVSEALSAIHTGRKSTRDASLRVIVSHFDLKPSNILLTKDEKLMITDFGRSIIEFVTGQDKPETYCNSGDPLYAPPESQRPSTAPEEGGHNITAQQNYDVWSLACIMIQVLLYLFDGNPSLPKSPLKNFQSRIGETDQRHRFFDNEGERKSCVESTIRDLQTQYRHEPAHHEYIKAITELILNMFDSNQYSRPSSEDVVERLKAADGEYEKTLTSQNKLASKVFEHKVASNYFNEVGWNNDDGLIVSFAAMDQIHIEVVDRADGSVKYNSQECRFRLFKKRGQKRSFRLVWAGKESQEPKEEDIIFPEWCFQPTYVFQNDKLDCALFPHLSKSEGLTYIFTFGTQKDVYSFQAALTQYEVLWDGDKSSTLMKADFTFMPHNGRKTFTLHGAYVQFWVQHETQVVGQERNPQASPYTVKSMAVFTKDNIIEIPLDNQRRFKILQPQKIVEIEVNWKKGQHHGFFETYWLPRVIPWTSQENQSSAFSESLLESPSLQPGQREIDKKEIKGKMTLDRMKNTKGNAPIDHIRVKILKGGAQIGVALKNYLPEE